MLFPEGKFGAERQSCTHTQSSVWRTTPVYFMFQCLCSETGNSSTFLLLRTLPLNSVTPPLAKFPYPWSQSETAAQWDRSDTHTCSGQLSQTGRQTPGQTVSMTAATRMSTLITWASTSVWRSCRRFTPRRRMAYLPGCSLRPTRTPHPPQTECPWVPWKQPRHHHLPPFHACATWGSKTDEAGRWRGWGWPDLDPQASWWTGPNLPPSPPRDNIPWSSRAWGRREGRGEICLQQEEESEGWQEEGWAEQRGTQSSYGRLSSGGWQTWTCRCYLQLCRGKVTRRASCTAWTTDTEIGRHDRAAVMQEGEEE